MSIKNLQGFLLVEVLLTVSIIAISLVVIMQSLLHVHRGTVQGAYHALAVLMMEEKMNEFMLDPESMVSLSGTYDDPLDFLTYNINVNKMNQGIDTALHQTTLTMSWEVSSKMHDINVDAFYLSRR